MGRGAFRRRRGRSWPIGAVRCLGRTGLAVAVTATALVASATPAIAASGHSSSQQVALIPQAGPLPAQGPNGIMPTSSNVTGYPNETFNQTFSNLSVSQITPANLAKYDTVALIQVRTRALSPAAKSALAAFVAGGGKLIIHDADETGANDYSFLLPGDATGSVSVGAGCTACGSSSGSSTIVKNSSLISSNAADASFVNLSDLYSFTDQGDSNLLVSSDPRWLALATGTNGLGEQGAQVAYATQNTGLIIYNGYDTDFIKAQASDPFRCNQPKLHFKCAAPPAAQPTVDWLAHMWYSELVQSWGQPSGGGPTVGPLPTTQPVSQIGTPIGTAPAGLPSAHRCVPRKSLYLRLKRLGHLRGQKVIQVDVYVGRKHVLRERRHFSNRTIRHLPRRGRYVVKVVATTARHYHLIAKARYRGC